MKNKSNTAKRSRPGLNIIDVFGIFLVLVRFAGIIIRVNSLKIDDYGHLSDYRITFKVENIAHTSTEHFKVSDVLRIAESGERLGRIELIESVKPASVYVKDEDGDLVLAEYPPDTRVDVVGSIIAKGTTENKIFCLEGGKQLVPGESFLVKSERMDFIITILELSPK